MTFLFCLLLALVAPPCTAYDGPGEACALDSVQKIDGSVVVAYRQQDKIIPAQTLQGFELKKLNALSVADAIRYFSGVQIKDYGGVGGLKTINVRSMGSQHVGVFYDGVQLGNAQNGQIDLGKYSLENMESVTLYNGQRSASLQSAKDYASASAVYLQTRTPSFEGGKRNNLHFKLAGGSFGTVNPSALWEQRLSDRVSNSFNAEFLYTTGKYKFTYSKKDGYDTTAVRQNGDVRAVRVEEGLFGKLKGDGSWKARIYFYNSERGYPGAFVRQEPGKFRHEDRQWDTDLFAQGSMFQRFGNYSFNVNVKYAYDYLHYLADPRIDVSTVYVNNHYHQQEVYLSTANEYRISDWWDASLAVDWQMNTLDADLINFVCPTRNTLLTALATSFRFRHLKLQGSLLHTFVNDRTREVGADAGKRNAFTPTAVIQYTPFDAMDLSFRAFCKRIFRMPTLNDLYYTFVGNKYLKPEYTVQYDAGITYGKRFSSSSFSDIELTVDGYYNEVENKIVAVPASNQFQWTMINLGLVKIKGLDAAAKAGMTFGKVAADIRLTYTWQKAQDFTDPASPYYGGQIPYIPWHSGSAVAGISFGGWAFNYSFIYTGERYESVANTPENYVQPWYTSDMSISRTLPLKSGDYLKLNLEINNIFNQQYEVVQCYPMPGTNFKIILTYDI